MYDILYSNINTNKRISVKAIHKKESSKALLSVLEISVRMLRDSSRAIGDY